MLTPYTIVHPPPCQCLWTKWSICSVFIRLWDWKITFLPCSRVFPPRTDVHWYFISFSQQIFSFPCYGWENRGIPNLPTGFWVCLGHKQGAFLMGVRVERGDSSWASPGWPSPSPLFLSPPLPFPLHGLEAVAPLWIWSNFSIWEQSLISQPLSQGLISLTISCRVPRSI